ncbi:alanine racemase [bacterium]|nr:alanine racemase [bacterium]
MVTTFRKRPTHLRIDLNALTHNLRIVREHAKDSQIMAILKADAYGHGLLPAAKKFADLGVNYFGVAFLEEGVELRRAGIEAPILVLGGLVGNQVKHFLDYHLDMTASSLYKAEQISREAQRMNRTARVHLKIDTGMNRIGVRVSNGAGFALDVARMPNIDLVGIFTHFVRAQGPDLELANRQFELFSELLNELRKKGIEFPLVHAANSSALFNLPHAHFNLVRPGLSLYGVPPGAHLYGKWKLKPAMSIVSETVYFKGIRKGSGVGYMHTWEAPRDGWLATLPLGYGDGYPRMLSNRADVLIRGKRYPVVGNISMDQAMVWLGDDEVGVGEEVVLIGSQGEENITVWELAKKAETIAYEILCGWTPRVPRIYEGSGWKP